MVSDDRDNLREKVRVLLKVNLSLIPVFERLVSSGAIAPGQGVAELLMVLAEARRDLEVIEEQRESWRRDD